ncbi:CHRD domain-containing protein [Demetria terragena]|uniref:CHRD domain-containing protein n=1 Tax=Demetria terragena TaxID=63959 RepID=UPI00037BA71F|nr:CHRD domain-containing protein [Demetria terragena]
MRTTSKTALGLAAFGMALAPIAGASPASAHATAHDFTANLTQLNDSGASGTAWIKLQGHTATVKVTTKGLLAGAPHAQHIHIGAKGQCPSNDTKGTGVNGALRVLDAIKDYGMIGQSLTTTGDVTPDSGLAVTRFPTGDGTYERTFKVSEDTRMALLKGKSAVVVHGVDLNKNGKYDGASKSELDPSLPEEATDPAACGALNMSQMNHMPNGGVQTGDGSTAASDNSSTMMGLAATALVAGAGGFVIARRRDAKQHG